MSHKGAGDSSSDEQSLFQRFSAGEGLVNDIESGKYAMKDLQPRIKKMVPLLEDVTRDVSRLGLFSSNETVEELPTSTLPYFLLPCYLGVFHHNTISDIDQKPEQLTIARVYYRNFLKRASQYGIATLALPWEEEEEGEESLPRHDPSLRITGEIDGKSSASVPDFRMSKIERFKFQKSFQEAMVKAKKSYDKNNDDDGALRDLYVAKIRFWCYKLLDELQSIEEELPILEMMIKKRGVQADGVEPNDDNITPAAPLKPFIIARSEQQKRVLGLGYPAVPTMTVDEWYNQKFGSHPLPGSSGPARQHSHGAGEECHSASEDEDVEDETKRIAQIRMDDYKDTHRRGWGNTHNKG